MLKTLVIYGLPFTMDIVVGLVLFVGRHSLASRGYGEETIASIMLGYGIGYTLSSLLMARIVKPRIARSFMLAALAGTASLCVVLANVDRLIIIQVLYAVFPLLVSLFFNSCQIYLLGISSEDSRPLAVTAGHFTFSWSLGYALGPFVSSLAKNTLPWAQIYYLASGVAVAMCALLYAYRPPRTERVLQSAQVQPETPRKQLPALVGSAWLGLLVGWTTWGTVLIFWPVQAEALAVPASLRGSMEFISALMQGLSALALTYVRGWHHKPGWLVVFGGVGLLGLGILSAVEHSLLLVSGALFFGAYLGSMFSYLVYHAMLDPEKAVRRVAINETFVGACFLIASPLAAVLRRNGSPFGHSYFGLALMFAAGIAAQALVAQSRMLSRRQTEDRRGQSIRVDPNS